MKNLKVKNILFSLLAMMAVAIFLTSCEREPIVEDDILGWKVDNTSNIDINEDVSILVLENILKNATDSSVAKSSMMCDCELIRDEADTGFSPGNVSALDILILLRMINDYDYSGDGCLEFFAPEGGFSLDAIGWINAGYPPPSIDYNQDGYTSGFGDPNLAFGLANTLGNITGNSGLCIDDLYCIRDYVLGILEC